MCQALVQDVNDVVRHHVDGILRSITFIPGTWDIIKLKKYLSVSKSKRTRYDMNTNKNKRAF